MYQLVVMTDGWNERPFEEFYSTIPKQQIQFPSVTVCPAGKMQRVISILTINKLVMGTCIKKNKKIIPLKSYQLIDILEIVYYKLLSDRNWRENNYNWACFYSNKIL